MPERDGQLAAPQRMSALVRPTRFVILLGAMLSSLLCMAAIRAQVPTTTGDMNVVFVCEHGNVKSLVASSLFNRAAMEHRLPFRSVARGVNPEASVPSEIAGKLREDQIDVGDYKPERLSSEDLVRAARIVAIGVDLSGFERGDPARFDRWDDVPPASVDYAAARDSLRHHIDRLLAELEADRSR